MKALVAQELSGPSGLAYIDVDDPADVGGDDAVVIDVGAAGVSFPDLLLLRGEYQLRLEPPFIPGMEVAGVVRSAPYESEFTPGQRVSALAMLGGWAERVAVPPENIRRTPDGLDDAEAVALLGNYQTMYFALAKRGGAAGRRDGAGARLGGRRRHGRHPDRKGVGRQSDRDGAPATGDGLREVAGRRRGAAADRRLAARRCWTRTDGRGVDLVVDPIGGEPFDDAIRALATEGRLLVIGFAAGAIPTVKVNRLLLRNVAVIGVGYGEFVNRKPGSAGGVRIRCRRARRGRAAATTADAVSAFRRPRGVAEPGRRRGARQGRAGAVMGPRALAFDVFGTVVDWRSSLIRELEKFGRTPWAATGLARFRRQLARRICARRWIGCVVATCHGQESMTCTG